MGDVRLDMGQQICNNKLLFGSILNLFVLDSWMKLHCNVFTHGMCLENFRFGCFIPECKTRYVWIDSSNGDNLKKGYKRLNTGNDVEQW